MRPEKTAVVDEIRQRLRDSEYALLVNVIGLNVAKVTDLRGRLREWFSRHADPARDGEGLSVTGSGQVREVSAGANAFV